MAQRLAQTIFYRKHAWIYMEWILRLYSLTCYCGLILNPRIFHLQKMLSDIFWPLLKKKFIEDPYFKYISLVIPISLTYIIFSSD